MNDTLRGPDLTKGVALSSVADGAMLLGHAHAGWYPASAARGAVLRHAAQDVADLARRLPRPLSALIRSAIVGAA